MFELLMMTAAGAAMFAGYKGARRFVTERLRFVDAIQRTRAPFIAGTAAALVAAPVVALLPVLGGGSAVLFGAAVGFGVARGAKAIRRRDGKEIMVV